MNSISYLILLLVVNCICCNIGLAWGKGDKEKAKKNGMYALFFALGALFGWLLTI